MTTRSLAASPSRAACPGVVVADQGRVGCGVSLELLDRLALQLASGLLLALGRWPRAAYALAAYANLTVAGVWAATRTVGIPIGPEAGVRLPVAAADLAATLLETATALVLLGVALAGSTRWTARLEHARVGGRRLAVWLATLAQVR